jgi:DNA-binding response OmpR family regulator
MSILVVEPNPVLQGLLSEQLNVLDQLVIYVDTAQQAAELMEAVRFHLLIVEPYREGTVDWLSALPYKPPTLVLSMMPKEQAMALANKIGAFYLQKPYHIHRFMDVVISLLAESRRGVKHGGLVAVM